MKPLNICTNVHLCYKHSISNLHKHNIACFIVKHEYTRAVTDCDECTPYPSVQSLEIMQTIKQSFRFVAILEAV